MIYPDMNITTSYPALVGVGPLYKTYEDFNFASGVILASVVGSVICIFQLQESVDILKDKAVVCTPGSAFMYPSGEELLSKYEDLCNCRFPTKDELTWYDSLRTV